VEKVDELENVVPNKEVESKWNVVRAKKKKKKTLLL
jgi:hypothetical protein